MGSRSLVTFYGFGAAWYIFYGIVIIDALIYIFAHHPDAIAAFNYCVLQLISLWVTGLHACYYIARFYLVVKRITCYDWFLSGLFIYLILPLTIVVSLNFWTLYLIDNGLIDRYSVLEGLGPIVNHMTHTSTVLFVLIEVFLKSKPKLKIKQSRVFWSMFATFVIYHITGTVCRMMSGQWTYPFLDYLYSPFLIELYLLGNCISGCGIVWATYITKEYSSKVVAYLSSYVKAGLRPN